MNKLEYQEHEIERMLLEMGSSFGEININKIAAKSAKEPYDLISRIQDLEHTFCFLAKRVYMLCLVYFESKQLTNYLEKFKSELEPIVFDNKKILESHFNDETEQFNNQILELFWSYVNPFPFCENLEYDVINKLNGLSYLENILISTNVIIKSLKKEPTSEFQVYNAVKIVINSVFPDVSSPSESFQKIAKCYKPDILIPSLNCAVEYKYAENEIKLIETIDQILVDVKGYENNQTYKLFYAVFYVKNQFWTKSRFESVWKEKKFPKNWKWIFVEGI